MIQTFNWDQIWSKLKLRNLRSRFVSAKSRAPNLHFTNASKYWPQILSPERQVWQYCYNNETYWLGLARQFISDHGVQIHFLIYFFTACRIFLLYLDDIMHAFEKIRQTLLNCSGLYHRHLVNRMDAIILTSLLIPMFTVA